MRVCLARWGSHSFGSLIGLIVSGTLFLALSRAEEITGKDLFERKWAAHDPRSPGGDGLGPLHNATSCAACHLLGGSGGAGGREHNVDLLSVVPKDVNAGAQSHFTAKIVELYPGFADPHSGVLPNVVLHKFGAEADYYALRAKLLGVEEPRPDAEPERRAIAAAAMARRRGKEPRFAETLVHGEIGLRRTQRNTPALWGAGLIDAVAQPVLVQLATVQAKEHPELSGRVPRSLQSGAGRFGWRGQTASLREFVLAACANELGLETPDHPQAITPLAPKYKCPGSDLSEHDVSMLVSFVANLPPPVTRAPRNPLERERMLAGSKTFDRIGCAHCHLRQVGIIDGLFSDLLLHDMGPALADPVEAVAEMRTVGMGMGSMMGYSGGGQIFRTEKVENPELAREWRTPPLWGVADSAPYLHDGRADTLPEAILLHGGEAATSIMRFRELTGEEQGSLIVFLKSLVAPPIRR